MNSFLRSILAPLALLMATQALAAQTDSLTVTPTEPLTTPILVDRVIAIVDEEPILLSELEREIESYRFEAETRGVELENDPAAIREQMLDRLVEVKLLVAQAKLDGLQISDDELDRMIATDMQELIDRFGSRAQLDAALAREGMTFEDLSSRQRELNRNQYFTARMVDLHIRRRIEITENEMRQYYEEHRSEVPAAPDTLQPRSILIVPKLSEEREAGVMAVLDQIQNALLAGQSFEDVARQFSEGPNASRGGDLGWVGRGDLFSPVLEQLAWQLPVGQIGPPLQTDRGVHVIKVTAREGERVRLSQIMRQIQLDEDELNAAENLANEVARQARGGADFCQLAKNYSDDPSSRDQCGDAGEVTVDKLPQAFRDALDGLPVGGIAGPVRGDAGWFVFQLEGRRAGEEVSFDSIRDRVRAYLTELRTEEELQKFLQDLRSKFYIELKA